MPKFYWTYHAKEPLRPVGQEQIVAARHPRRELLIVLAVDWPLALMASGRATPSVPSIYGSPCLQISIMMNCRTHKEHGCNRRGWRRQSFCDSNMKQTDSVGKAAGLRQLCGQRKLRTNGKGGEKRAGMNKLKPRDWLGHSEEGLTSSASVRSAFSFEPIPKPETGDDAWNRLGQRSSHQISCTG